MSTPLVPQDLGQLRRHFEYALKHWDVLRRAFVQDNDMTGDTVKALLARVLRENTHPIILPDSHEEARIDFLARGGLFQIDVACQDSSERKLIIAFTDGFFFRIAEQVTQSEDEALLHPDTDRFIASMRARQSRPFIHT